MVNGWERLERRQTPYKRSKQQRCQSSQTQPAVTGENASLCLIVLTVYIGADSIMQSDEANDWQSYRYGRHPMIRKSLSVDGLIRFILYC